MIFSNARFASATFSLFPVIMKIFCWFASSLSIFTPYIISILFSLSPWCPIISPAMFCGALTIPISVWPLSIFPGSCLFWLVCWVVEVWGLLCVVVCW